MISCVLMLRTGHAAAAVVPVAVQARGHCAGNDASGAAALDGTAGTEQRLYQCMFCSHLPLSAGVSAQGAALAFTARLACSRPFSACLPTCVMAEGGERPWVVFRGVGKVAGSYQKRARLYVFS